MLTFISLSKFVEKFKTRKMRTRRQRVKQFGLPMEALESRVLPAATIVGLPGAGATRTFEDSTGDIVTVRVSGTTGTATFTDAGAGAVADGDDIAGVVITGASTDFTLTYSFDASGDVADDPLTLLVDETFDSPDTVEMGNITSSRVIKGVYSVPLNDAGAQIGSFTLGSFIGPGFSLHGGLNADDVVGNATDVGVDLSGSLGSTNAINFRGNVDADIRIRGSLNGTIAFGDGVTVDSAWVVNGAVGGNGGIGGSGDFLGTATFVGTFYGSATVDGDVDGNWTFNSSVPASAQLKADDWFDVNALRNFGGQILSNSGISLDVGGSITGTANLSGTDDVVVNVTGSILSGARFSSSSDVVATVGGNVSGIFTASGDVTLDVGGSLTNATADSGSSLEITVGRGIVNSKFSGTENTFDVIGGITNSTIYSTSDLTLNVTGNVTGTKLHSDSSTASITISGNLVNSQISNTSYDVELYVGGNMVNSTVLSASSDVTVEVRGNVSGSSITAESQVSLAVGGSLSSTRVVTGTSNIDAVVGGSVSDSTFISTNSEIEITVGDEVVLELPAVDVTIAGRLSNMTRTVVETHSEATLDITGSLISSRIAATYVEVTTGADVTGSTITATDSDLSMDVGRDLLSSTIDANTFVDVTVGRHMTRSQLSSNSSDITLAVTGNVTNSSVSSPESDITATVGGNFVNSSLTSDEDIELDVTGNASGTLTSYDSDITLTVGGSFSGKAIADENLEADLGSLNGSLTVGSDLDLFVTGNVSAASVIQTTSVDDLGDADDIGFRVGGTFAGNLTAIYFQSDEADGTNDLVLGNVLTTARFNIGLFDGTAGELYRFGGSFRGHLAIAQSLDVDLEFNGNVHSIIIGGTVGVTQNSTIEIAGTLTFLSSNSLFDPTGAGDGDFKDGDGNVTGDLITAGFTTVVPLETP